MCANVRTRPVDFDTVGARVWSWRTRLPIASTETHLDRAIKLANASRYYEANIALKAIEDSVTMDSITCSDLPTTPKSAKNAS